MTISIDPKQSSQPVDQLFELRYAPGPNWKPELTMAEQDLAAHVEHMKSLGKRGALVTAAPYAEDAGGVALLWAVDAASAQAVAVADPAVSAGTMTCEARRVIPRAGAVDRNAAVRRRNENVIRRLFDAVAARDAFALGCYTPDAVIHEAASLPYGGDYKGTDGVIQHARCYRQHWDTLQTAEERQLEPEIFSSGDRVGVVWRQRGRHTEPDRQLDEPVVSLYTLADGRITDARMFHFDSALIAGFLDAGPEASTLAQREAALNACLEAGQFHAALEQFFTDDAELAEAGQPPTRGKEANLMRETVFLGALAAISARCVGQAVHGDTSFSEWQYKLEFRTGRTLEYAQVARRKWHNGLVVREDFFHPDFPAWFATEIRAAASPDGPEPASSHRT